MGGREGPEQYAPAQQLADLPALAQGTERERDGKLPLKQIARDAHRRMQAATVQGPPADRYKPYSVSHLSEVLRGVAQPSPTLAYYLASVLVPFLASAIAARSRGSSRDA